MYDIITFLNNIGFKLNKVKKNNYYFHFENYRIYIYNDKINYSSEIILTKNIEDKVYRIAYMEYDEFDEIEFLTKCVEGDDYFKEILRDIKIKKILTNNK